MSQQPSEAFKFGAFLGALQVGIERMVRDINEGAAAMRAQLAHAQVARLQLPPPGSEGRSKLRYQNRIEAERRVGHKYVQQQFAQLRTELGLTETGERR